MEEETLMMLNNTREVEQVKVIEYMLSSMSKELLCKFPDNSAFDFDYTQSSIWSPLVPHPSNPSSPLNTNGLQKKLSYEEENEEDGASMMVKKFTENVVDKVSGSCVFSCFGAGCKIGKKKGWKKVLKAATKQFKKTMKKKDSGAHLKLSSNGYTHLPYYY
ncbi:hypothetical protein CTI12_AA581330 [Artemisia annua]|uniref:Uncharacterized protein n=1 Tax=Artemisia annua TaxID=35608 RepID=A0A2U1KNT1_ARTAN|nr:hypothetical protein CTI12_AA581330 [Artemisia annua]